MAHILQGGVLYCQIDRFNAVSENSEEPCSRLIGVSPDEFHLDAFYRGVDAYTVDIAPPIAFSPDFAYDDAAFGAGIFASWFEVTFATNPDGRSFVYPTFGIDEAACIQVRSVRLISAYPLPRFPAFNPPPVVQATHWQCSAFEVGQGMASLIHSKFSKDAFLFDAGAGTPIKRPNYLAGRLTAYDLRTSTTGLDVLFFLSHGDSDHWRMLGWDKQLRNAITTFVVPHGMRRIAFFDKTVLPRVCERATHITNWKLGTSATLDVYRTNPPAPTSNNDGLIAVFEDGGRRVLIAGDCVYSELLKDADATVQALPKNDYAAIVVPHHGDSASANHVPMASSTIAAQPVAFFSAGNHQGYGHPTAASLQNHQSAGFRNHVRQAPTGINRVPLL